MSTNLKYRQLKAFAMAVETGSFKAAADRLSVTQPSFSSLIKELERDVDVLLFDRTTRGCVLTAPGQAFYEEIKGALGQLEDAYRYIQDVGKGSRGKLSLAALPSLAAGIVTGKLGEFKRSHPGVRILLSERKNDQILEAVRRGEVELGIGSMWQPDPDLRFQPLFTDRMMFVVPKGHPLESMRPVWKSADRFDLILMPSGPTEFALKASQMTRPPAFEVEHLATALAMVRNGLGITILPSSVVPTLNMDGLACLPIQGSLATRPLGTIVRQGTRLSAPATAFAALLRTP
ncbi:MAG: LysR family regulatory protein [Ramlibacter sp.]|jgi:LysR family carnitine catabolism transcriptional activator|nr:LysR family regulatory protein [Ramlibacter sp.]